MTKRYTIYFFLIVDLIRFLGGMADAILVCKEITNMYINSDTVTGIRQLADIFQAIRSTRKELEACKDDKLKQREVLARLLSLYATISGSEMAAVAQYAAFSKVS